MPNAVVFVYNGEVESSILKDPHPNDPFIKPRIVGRKTIIHHGSEEPNASPKAHRELSGRTAAPSLREGKLARVDRQLGCR